MFKASKAHNRANQSSEQDAKELHLNQQQISHVVAVLLLLSFFIFMAGFYWGKKSSIGPLTEQLESDALADKVSYAFSSLYDLQEQEDEEAATKEETSRETTQELPTANITTRYYSKLAGFGTIKRARACVRQLKEKGFNVTVMTRESTDVHGKTITWYQVVTQPLESKNELLALIEKIKSTRGCIAPSQKCEITEITQET